MSRLFSNNAASTLAASIVPGDTTITIQTSDANEFPSPSGAQTFDVTIHEGSTIEIVSCTARSVASLTVVRGQQGTTASSFSTNAVVEHRLTAAALTAFETTNVITTQGDLIQGGASGVPERLALSGAMLGVSAGKWAGRTAAQARGDLDVPSTTEAVLDTIIDAKGDLLAGTAADTIARFAVGTDGQLLSALSTAASGLEWRTYPRGEVNNLVVKQTTGSEASSVTITADAMDIEGYRATSINVAAALTASGAGGLDTGAEAADTTYYLWLIRKSTDGTVNGLLSTSATAPTMPSGYDQKRLISHRRNDGASNMIRTIQSNEMVLGDYQDMSLAAGISASADLDTTSFVPAAIADFLLIRQFCSGTNGNWALDDKDDSSIRYATALGASNPLVSWARKNASNLITATEVGGADTFTAAIAGWRVKVL